MEANQQAGVEMVSDGVFDKEAVFSAVQNNKIVWIQRLLRVNHESN